LHAAVIPRFALSVTAQTLGALGEMYDSARGRGVYFHTHLSENVAEVAAVRDVYEVDTYLDTYDGKFGAGRQVAPRPAQHNGSRGALRGRRTRADG
jgi:guanine deaminase